MARHNQSLNIESKNDNHVHFSDWVKSIAQLKLKGATIVMISDWNDATELDLKRLQHLQQHNDILSLMVSDPMEQSLPEKITHSRWVIGDGSYQLSLDTGSKVDIANETLRSTSHIKREQLAKIMAFNNLPFINLDTSGEHIKQYKRSIGGRDDYPANPTFYLYS